MSDVATKSVLDKSFTAQMYLTLSLNQYEDELEQEVSCHLDRTGMDPACVLVQLTVTMETKGSINNPTLSNKVSLCM